MNIELIENTFTALSSHSEQLVSRFYEELFDQYPDVKPLFNNNSMDEQRDKLLKALVMVVNNLRNPESLNQALSSLGKRHKDYGALPAHYPAVVDTLLTVMQEVAGDLWTEEVSHEWTGALNHVAETMLSVYES